MFSQNMAVFASTKEQVCSNALKELVETDQVSREKLQEFLKLHADLTMHKMAYSLHRHLLTTERFKIEDQILALVKKMENPNPEFMAIKQQFEKNKLSRHHLANIMPYMKDIINDQMYEQDPYKRANFLIGENDLKMLSILGEAELVLDNGRYDSRFISSHNDHRSIFNILQMINDEVEKSKLDKGDVQIRMGKRLQDIQTEIVNLLDSLKMPSECLEIYSACRVENGDQGMIQEDFVNLVLDVTDRASNLYRYRYLKYGDTQLITNQNDYEVKLNKKNKKEQNDNVINGSELKKSESKIVQDYLVQHVLDHLPYFVSRDLLEKDPELLSSLAKAIDAGVLTQSDKEKRVFHYKGDTYYLPELWNGTYSGNRLVTEYKDWLNQNRLIPLKKLFTFDDEFETPSSISKEAQKDFKRTRDEQLYIFKNNFSFEFGGKLYDIKTGQLITADGQGLLSYKKGTIENSTGDENHQSPELDTRKASAIMQNERSYIMDDEVYHISGQPVDIDKEYERYKSHFENTSINVNKTSQTNHLPTKSEILALEQVEPVKYGLVIKAMTDRNRSFTYEGKVYDLYSRKPFEPLSSKQGKDFLNEQRVNSGLTIRQDISSENVSAILNDNDSYMKDGKIYNTLSGRQIASKGQITEVEDGYYEHDPIFNNELNLNNQSNEDILKNYFQSKNAKECNYHSILDKKQNLLKVYNGQGEVVFKQEVILGKIGDSKSSGHTPAGILYPNSDNGLEQSYLPEIRFSAIDEDNLDLVLALNNEDKLDNRSSNGSTLMPMAALSEYTEKYSKNNCPVYVLPDRDDIKFQLRDGKLEFKPFAKDHFSQNCIQTNKNKECSGDYHFETYDEFTAKDVRISFEDLSLENNVSRAFASSLVKNKKDLMQKLSLSNGEYNELAKMAIAVLGVESGFGTEKAYKLKESKTVVPIIAPGGIPMGVMNVDVGQGLVTALKVTDKIQNFDIFGDKKFTDIFNADEYKNSRGLTQIKDVRGFLKDEYPQITEGNLTDPENAAIATMFVLSKKYHLLEYIKSKHPAINESNKFDYLYYIYSGSAHRVTTKNATPAINKKSKELIAYASKIKVLTK